MTVVAITGGIGAGKTLVSSVLANRGAMVIDADLLSRQAVAPGTNGLAQIVDTFGAGVLHQDGSLNRTALAEIVFATPEARVTLNSIVHPEVRRLYEEEKKKLARSHPDSLVIYDVPLLAEAQSTEEFDAIVVVHAPAEVRISRLVNHRGLSESEARSRVEAQATDAERLALATVVIDASQSEADTVRQAKELYSALETLWPDSLAMLPELFPRSSS